MKRIVFLFLLAGAIPLVGYAQQSVSIGTDQINNNAVLWLQGNGSQGLILPVVTNRTGVTATKGMIVFDDTDKKVYYNNGTAWVEVGGGGTGVAQTLTLTGNTLTISDGNSIKIAATDPTVSNQLLMWDGAKWVAVTLSQDITNTNGAIAVNGLKGKTIPALPATTQALVYNGTSWVFQPLSAGGVTSITAGTGLTGGVITSTGTINVDIGTTANKIVQLDGSGRLPAVDGSQLTNLAGGGDITGITAGTGLTGGATSGNATLNVDAGVTANKIVQLDASGRLPAVDGSQLTNLAGGGDITGVTAGTGLTGGATSGNATLSVDAGITANKIVQLDGSGRLPAIDGSQLTNLPGGGTVTDVSVVSANGVSGAVSNASSTPAITLSLGAITPVSVAASGTISGVNLSGTNTGDQTTITGNAGTATVLQTGRTIGMTGDVTYTSPSFNGSGNVTAPATVTRINGNTIPLNASGALTNDGLGNLSWIPSGGSGTVTSVGLTLPAIFSVTGSPVTTAGTLAATLASQPAATVFAAPTGAVGAPTFRTLVATDIPTLDASKITTGTLPIAQGGTGATSPTAALTNLGAMNNTLNAGEIFVGNASNVATGVAVSGDGTMSSTGTFAIALGVIVDSDVNASAAIAGTKVNPNFGAQNVASTGSGSFGQLILSNEIRLGADAGSSGQVLTSAGPGVVPTWTTPSGSSLINNTGTRNLFAGTPVSTSGTDNAIFGAFAGAANTGDYNVLVGTQAGQAKTVGSLNTIVGWFAGHASTTASFNGNTFLGAQSGQNTTGGPNTFIGERSGQANSTGTQNLFAGNGAGLANTTGGRNTILGYQANVGSGGLQNATAIGYQATVNASNSMVLGGTGANAVNVGIGNTNPNALLSLGDLLTTPVGDRSVYMSDDGGDTYFETASGDMSEGLVMHGAGTGESGIVRNLNSNGFMAGKPVGLHMFNDLAEPIMFTTTNIERMRIQGNGNVGIGRTPTTNQLEISGNASKAAAGGWLNNSDKRIKTDIQDIDNSLDLINRIRPVKYKYTEEWKRRNPSIKDQYYYSFIAQEYQRVFPEAVQGSGEYLEGDKTEILQIDTHNAQIVTIKAVQEQQKLIEAQQNEIDNLKKELAEIKSYLSIEAKVEKKKKGRK